jgi:hypothetical protein
MWCEEYGESEGDAIKGTADTWEGPREMASRWAEWHDMNGAEYDIAGKNKTVRVSVKDCTTGATTVWDVTGESVPHYSARSATPNANVCGLPLGKD